MKKICLLIACLACHGWVHAEENPFMPEAKLKGADVSTWNVGAGFTKKLLHTNFEWVNPYGIAYAKVGAFLNDDNAFGAQVGFHYPYQLTGTDKNGYYLGVYAGHVDSRSYSGKDEANLGVGADLAYIWLNSERISTFSVGAGVREPLEDANGNTVKKAEPVFQFSYTLSFGL